MNDLAAELAAHRMILERLMAYVPEAVLRDWVDQASSQVEFLEGGGETNPPLSEGEKRGADIAHRLYADALNRKISHGSTEKGFV